MSPKKRRRDFFFRHRGYIADANVGHVPLTIVAALTLLTTPVATFAHPAETGRERPPIQIGAGPAHFSMADLDISLGGISAAPEVRLTWP